MLTNGFIFTGGVLLATKN